MDKKIFFIYCILLLILSTKCGEGPNYEDANFEYDENDRNNYFKNYLKEYLIERKLFNSNKVVKPEDIKKIILEILSGSDEEHPIEQVGDAVNELCDYFVNLYYKERKEIKGKEIYNLIDINTIFMRLEKMMGFGEKEEEEEINVNKDDLL